MASQGPGDHRRKWDLNKYERILSEEEEKEAAKKAKTCMPPVKRDNLKARDFKVDLDSKLGKSVVLTKATPETSSGGYYCNVCDCIVKDSINFLDHINGKKHQRNLGMSMKIERSSADQVRQRFELNKQKKEEKKKEYNFEERMKELKEQEEREKALKKEKQKESKKRKHDEMNEFENVDNDMAAIMGFSGFSSSKKN